ncbi:MFS transporter [Streptomyces pulveraceus]|uniref:MFS transporter n=1 Tax=Streptomyces pulveraceus TaxID=68258 RepID=A0ABW1GIX4_9ACTN
MATGGYVGTAVTPGAIGLATAVWPVGVLRAMAWASRGLRSPARDSLLASLVTPRAYGRAYGLERAGDNLGAVAGPLAATGLVVWVSIRPAFWFAFIPGRPGRSLHHDRGPRGPAPQRRRCSGAHPAAVRRVAGRGAAKSSRPSRQITASPSRTVPGRSVMPATARSIQCRVTTLPDRAYSTTVSSVRRSTVRSR